MAWELLWSEEHMADLEKSYGPQVREQAEKKLDDKEEQIQHMQRAEQVVKRRTVPSRNGA
ncbi:MAG: hypothetical protein SVU88_01845 [Candidatus Nanohaloarchaea archaeon]|nr:hypothetical protein [Candidatus Nanohaloarchaea archaeon]